MLFIFESWRVVRQDMDASIAFDPYTWEVQRVVVVMEDSSYDWMHIQKPQALEAEHQ